MEKFNKLPLEEQEKRKSLNKKILKFGCLPIVVLFIMVAIFAPSDNTTDISAVDTTSATTSDNVTSDSVKMKETLMREIESTNDSFKSKSFRGSIASVQLELVLFEEWAKYIKSGLESDSKENKALAKRLRENVVKIQLKEFPKMRKEWAKIAKNTLWEEDIDVLLTGNSIVNFTGAIYASNKGIKLTQEKVYEILTSLRFKEVRYRWYKGEDEFTYYKLEVKKDSEV